MSSSSGHRAGAATAVVLLVAGAVLVGLVVRGPGDARSAGPTSPASSPAPAAPQVPPGSPVPAPVVSGSRTAVPSLPPAVRSVPSVPASSPTAPTSTGSPPSEPTLPTEPTEPAAVAVLPLGDSITYGLSLGTQVTPGGYRGYLSADLTAAGVAHRFVGTSSANPPVGPVGPGLDPATFLHDGWPGARVDQVRQAVVGPSLLDGGSWFADTAARPALDPDVVVVHLGTNDIGQAWDPGTTYPGGYTDTDPAERAVFVRHLGRRLVRLVEDLRARRPGTAVVVCTLVPMPGDTDAAFAREVRRNVVPRLDRPGEPAVLADLAAEFPADPALLADGVHPTAAGYQAMAATVARSVVQVAGDVAAAERRPR